MAADLGTRAIDALVHPTLWNQGLSSSKLVNYMQSGLRDRPDFPNVHPAGHGFTLAGEQQLKILSVVQRMIQWCPAIP